MIIDKLKKIKIIYFDWDKDWEKTEKQKKRYHQFRGEEMHIFSGEIKEIKEAPGDEEESGWQGEKLMKIKEVINILELMKPFPRNMKEYYSTQLKIMKENESSR